MKGLALRGRRARFGGGLRPAAEYVEHQRRSGGGVSGDSAQGRATRSETRGANSRGGRFFQLKKCFERPTRLRERTLKVSSTRLGTVDRGRVGRHHARPTLPPHGRDGFRVDHLLDMSPGATGAPNAPPRVPGDPRRGRDRLAPNGHPSGLPLGTFAAVALPLAPPRRVSGTAPSTAPRARAGCARAPTPGARTRRTRAPRGSRRTRARSDARPFACGERGCA